MYSYLPLNPCWLCFPLGSTPHFGSLNCAQAFLREDHLFKKGNHRRSILNLFSFCPFNGELESVDDTRAKKNSDVKKFLLQRKNDFPPR